jgi:hypothetical protein
MRYIPTALVAFAKKKSASNALQRASKYVSKDSEVGQKLEQEHERRSQLWK